MERPSELLGLTATPERTDGLDIREFFDGRIAVELRLWDALKLTCCGPFHYFGIADNVDLRSVTRIRGSYDSKALHAAYVDNDGRARLIPGQFQEKLSDVSQARALGFVAACPGDPNRPLLAVVDCRHMNEPRSGSRG